LRQGAALVVRVVGAHEVVFVRADSCRWTR